MHERFPSKLDSDFKDNLVTNRQDSVDNLELRNKTNFEVLFNQYASITIRRF